MAVNSLHSSTQNNCQPLTWAAVLFETRVWAAERLMGFALRVIPKRTQHSRILLRAISTYYLAVEELGDFNGQR
jgi:hypothetical protein